MCLAAERQVQILMVFVVFSMNFQQLLNVSQIKFSGYLLPVFQITKTLISGEESSLLE